MFLDCLNPVFRAAGEKSAARAQKGADGCLIETDKKNHDRFHHRDISV
jgi:hypothetical protein